MAPLPFRLKLRPKSCTDALLHLRAAAMTSVGFQGLDACSFKTHLGMVCARRTRLVAATATVAMLTAVATIAARPIGLRVPPWRPDGSWLESKTTTLRLLHSLSCAVWSVLSR